MNKSYAKILFFLFLLFIFAKCSSDDDETSKVHLDLQQIRERGKIIALTGYNAYSYFIYRGQPMGFEYELVNRLADHLGVDVEFKIEKNIKKMFSLLNSGKGDLIAFNLTVTKPRTKKVAFTHYHNTTKQVLVQRRPHNWRKMKVHEIENKLIRDPNDLIDKTVYVRNGSAYLSRLHHLSDEIGGDINIVEADSNLNIEDLIEMVADGKIKYTVADENIAKLNQSYYSNLDISTELSLSQRIAWAVRKNSPVLLKEINRWIDSMRRTADYYVIRKKYFENRRSYRTRLASDFLYHEGGQISEYDDLLKKYADSLKWDWRILASLIYQESQFDPTAQSWAGAVGLMQLMPATAQMYEVSDRTDPKQSIEAGIKYLIYLDDFWKQYITSKTERIKFVLASYNIGLGHITDARKLAQKYGSDPNVWENSVEFYLLQKSKSKYYNDDVVEYGYCRGIETVNYVKDILDRYFQYKQFVS